MTEDHPQPNQDAAPTPDSAPAEPSAASRPKAPGLKGPSVSSKMAYSLFSPETRTGRFFRSFLRTLALVVGFFALGFLAAYILLYRPTDDRLKKSQIEGTQTAGQLDQIRQDLSKSQQDLKTAQDQADQAKTRLEALQTRAQVLNTMNAVVTAKLAVSNNNKNAAAAALGDAQAGLEKVQPQLQKIDAAQVSSIQALFTLSRVDLDRDLKLALQDLDRLQNELNRMDQNFQNP